MYLFFIGLFSHVNYYSVLSSVPYAIQYSPVDNLFYIY